jgi:hypothetical protein
MEVVLAENEEERERTKFNCPCGCGDEIDVSNPIARNDWIYCGFCQASIFIWCAKSLKCPRCCDSCVSVCDDSLPSTIACLCKQTTCPVLKEGDVQRNQCRRCCNVIAKQCGFFHDDQILENHSSICYECVVYLPKFYVRSCEFVFNKIT